MSNFLAYGNRIVGGGSSQSGGGGHVIVNASGTELAQEDKLQFAGSLKTTDDSTNGKTIVDDSPTEMTWTAWSALTAEEQAAIPKALITDVPDVSGTISSNLLTKLWENPDPTSEFGAYDINLSSSDYDFLIVIFKYFKSIDIKFNVTVPKGTNGIPLIASIQGNTTMMVQFQRLLNRTSDTKYIADNAYYMTVTMEVQ